MGAMGAIAPALTGEVRGHLHEAGPLAGAAVLAAGEDLTSSGRSAEVLRMRKPRETSVVLPVCIRSIAGNTPITRSISGCPVGVGRPAAAAEPPRDQLCFSALTKSILRRVPIRTSGNVVARRQRDSSRAAINRGIEVPAIAVARSLVHITSYRPGGSCRSTTAPGVSNSKNERRSTTFPVASRTTTYEVWPSM